MDRSSYAVLYGLNLTKVQQEKVRRKVEKIVQILHDAGHVHGDIRNTNILVDLGSLDSDDVKVHLVDFDWAGLIGEARYPIGVNGKTVKRPEGAEDGEIITIEHDNAMVSYLFT
jgi:serine/threonine protein kinase